jgi:hypothetical protein
LLGKPKEMVRPIISSAGRSHLMTADKAAGSAVRRELGGCLKCSG